MPDTNSLRAHQIRARKLIRQSIGLAHLRIGCQVSLDIPHRECDAVGIIHWH